jgi:hypothetical protein
MINAYNSRDLNQGDREKATIFLLHIKQQQMNGSKNQKKPNPDPERKTHPVPPEIKPIPEKQEQPVPAPEIQQPEIPERKEQPLQPGEPEKQ